MKRKIFRMICMAVVMASSAYLIWYGYLWRQNQKIYDKVFEQLAEYPETGETGEQYPDYELWNDTALETFRQINPDVVGMLYIPDTVLCYPVVMTEEEGGSYYLYRDLYGKSNINGSVFADYRSPLLNPDYGEDQGKETDMQNIILYGHNMRNGSMFGTIRKYTDPEFFQAHREVYFNYGQDGSKRYEICSVLTLRTDDPYDRELFGRYTVPEDQKDTFVSYLRKRSLYETGINFGTDDSFLILLTCYSGVKNGRVAVVAKQASW